MLLVILPPCHHLTCYPSHILNIILYHCIFPEHNFLSAINVPSTIFCCSLYTLACLWPSSLSPVHLLSPLISDLISHNFFILLLSIMLDSNHCLFPDLLIFPFSFNQTVGHSSIHVHHSLHSSPSLLHCLPHSCIPILPAINSLSLFSFYPSFCFLQVHHYTISTILSLLPARIAMYLLYTKALFLSLSHILTSQHLAQSHYPQYCISDNAEQLQAFLVLLLVPGI